MLPWTILLRSSCRCRGSCLMGKWQHHSSSNKACLCIIMNYIMRAGQCCGVVVACDQFYGCCSKGPDSASDGGVSTGRGTSLQLM